MSDLSGYEYKCSAGETFDSVSLALYGDERYACELMAVNPALCRICVFTGGEVLDIPIVALPDGEQENEYAPARAPWKEA